jgi:hypothetical protein
VHIIGVIRYANTENGSTTCEPDGRNIVIITLLRAGAKGRVRVVRNKITFLNSAPISQVYSEMFASQNVRSRWWASLV